MFTADGELREAFRDLQPSAPSPTQEPSEPPPAAAPSEANLSVGAPPRSPTDQPPAGPPIDVGTTAEDPEAPSFFDLVGLLAEPATMYLREAHSADPQTAVQSLELARLHIELLTVLRAKTEGNLSQPETAMLEDVVYQLRSGYVGLRS